MTAYLWCLFKQWWRREKNSLRDCHRCARWLQRVRVRWRWVRGSHDGTWGRLRTGRITNTFFVQIHFFWRPFTNSKFRCHFSLEKTMISLRIFSITWNQWPSLLQSEMKRVTELPFCLFLSDDTVLWEKLEVMLLTLPGQWSVLRLWLRRPGEWWRGLRRWSLWRRKLWRWRIWRHLGPTRKPKWSLNICRTIYYCIYHRGKSIKIQKKKSKKYFYLHLHLLLFTFLKQWRKNKQSKG